MKVTFYTCENDRRKMNKSLTEVKSFSDVKLKDNQSIIEPHIILKTFEEFNTVNMVYISDFDRYYFIKDKITVTGGMIEFVCHSDVLYNTRSEMMEQYCVVGRSTTGGSSYIVDDKAVIDSRPKYTVIPFSEDVFSEHFDYVLNIAGAHEIEEGE